MSTRTRLQQAWLKRGLLACALWPLSQVYAALLSLRRVLYQLGIKRTARLPVPVVVVGNVVVGGAGKTPTVIQVIEHLRRQGWTPGVVSRGHGRHGNGCIAVSAASSPDRVGDEPLLIAQRTGAPLVVGRQRVRAGQHLLQHHPEVDILVCDDGMQHWDLARDLTVVVFDDRGTGNGWLLPAGMLRESWPAPPWGKSKMVILRNTAAAHPSRPTALSRHRAWPSYTAQRRLSPVAVASDGTRCALQDVASRCGEHPLAALAGIAQPEAFFAMLRAQGIPLSRTLALPDHADAVTLAGAIDASDQTTWFCTEKDADKLFALSPPHRPPNPVWAVPLEQIPEAGFFDAVDEALNGLSSAHGRQTP